VDPSGDGGGGLTATGLFSGFCGAQSSPTAKFWGECGTRLTQANLTHRVRWLDSVDCNEKKAERRAAATATFVMQPSSFWPRIGREDLTHLRVDRRAGVADGTTSFYYQTRSALLRGAIDRVVQLDVADFTGALNAPTDEEVDSLLSRLAEQAMRTVIEPERSRARARFELMMIASRDPDLSMVFDGLTDRFVAISEAAVAQVQPAGTSVDQELIKEQAFAVVNFLGGFLFQLAYSLVRLDSAQCLEGYLHAVIAGVAAEHARIKNAR
jgi:DNA-binding transcriptional regulator YbjK